MNRTVAIIDYGVGNVHSVSNALSYLGYKNSLTRDSDVIRRASAIILPGVGAFSEAVMNLQRFGLFDILNEEAFVREKPILGICLGMQVLGNSSEESIGYKGFEWIDFDVVSIPKMNGLRIPHVGWNTVQVKGEYCLFKNLESDPHFYFDHSFYVKCMDEFIVATCGYGTEIPVVVAHKNIVGVQFHPEKSQTNGLKLFRNFFRYFGV